MPYAGQPANDNLTEGFGQQPVPAKYRGADRFLTS